MYPVVGREEERTGKDMAQRKQKFEPTKTLLWEGESDAGEKKQDRNKRLVVEDHLRDVKQREGKLHVVAHAFNPALGDWDRWIPVSSSLVWSTGLVVGQSGIYSNTPSQTNKTKHNEERAGRSRRHMGIPGNFKIWLRLATAHVLIVASVLPANPRRPDIGILKANLKEQLESSGLKNSGQCTARVRKDDEDGRQLGRRRTREAVREQGCWHLRKHREREVWGGSCKVSETADPSNDPMNKGFS